MANSNGWGDGASNNSIGWGQGANNATGWGSSQATSWSGLTNIVGTSLDADASAFITAAAITDATQQSAIDTLVTGLKTDGIWTKMKAIYPFVGGTATSHKFNLKDPRDLDAAFRLAFSGGWTHSSNGALPNGTNAFADTKLNPLSTLTLYSNHISYYSRTNNNAGVDFDMGVGTQLGNMSNSLFIRRSSNTAGYDSGNVITNNRISFSNTNSLGFYNGSITANNSRKYYKNGVSQISNTTVLTQDNPSANIFIGAYNEYNVAGASYYGTKQCAFSTIGDGLTNTDASNLYTRVQAFQTTLNRQV